MHPIVAQVSAGVEQLPAILERGRDIVVTAGAGTGKTRTLVARYLALLAEGLPLRGIVAITFTRKAAREMRNRVREEVKSYLKRGDLTAIERDEWQARYTALDAARIGTIHSLCSEILRFHPAEAGVDPRFAVPEEGRSSLLRARAVDEALAWAADDEQAARLFGLLSVDLFRSVTRALLDQRLDTTAFLTQKPDEVWSSWRARAIREMRQFIDDPEVLASFQALMHLRLDGSLDRAEAVGDRLAAPLAQLLKRWEIVAQARRHSDWAAISEQLAPLRRDMKLVGRAANWEPAHPKHVLRILRELYDGRLAPWVGGGVSLRLDRAVVEVLPALRSVLQQAESAYQRSLQGQHALDFDDLEAGALKLLRMHPNVCARWQDQVAAILVDEFQDTNARQRDLIDLLNGNEGKLFIVGDAKQSIYRFRGAEVTVFRREREKIGHRGAAYRLATSYRAHRTLVEGLNRLMEPVLGACEDSDRPWVEPFSRLLHHREHPRSGMRSPFVELHLTVGTKGSGALDRAADAIAARIASLADCGVGYGEMAILCRASRAFAYYENALDRARIPFLTVAGRGFYSRPEIRDLLNALAALSDPSDDLALVGLLRSPALAVSDAGLYRLCVIRDRDGRAKALWDVLHESGTELEGEDARRAQRASQLISELHAQVGRSRVADVLKSFLDATEYRAALLGAGDGRSARNVSKLVAHADTSGSVHISEFLEFVEGIRAGGAREGEARATTEGAVQIMTVHAAKGLEFPIVILGDATYQGSFPAGMLVSRELGVLLPLQDDEGNRPALYQIARGIEQDMEDAESDRLLYVAATRARDKLLISACVSVRKDGSLGSMGGWLGKIAPVIGLDALHVDYDVGGSRAVSRHLDASGTQISCTVYEPDVQFEVLPVEAEANPQGRIGLPPRLLGPVGGSQEAADPRSREDQRDPPRRVWRVVPVAAQARAPAWVVGSMVHAALAAWRFPDDAYGRWAEARARGHGLSDFSQISHAIRESRRLLRRFRAHRLAAEMERATRRLHEVPYSLATETGVERGIIDALFLSDGRWTLVEFKTDEVHGEAELATIADERCYHRQVGRYVAAVERLVGHRPTAVICWLNYAGGIRLVRS